jgi:hypothetical protein
MKINNKNAQAVDDARNWVSLNTRDFMITGENKMSVTLEQERKYIQRNGTRCPYCESRDIEADSARLDGSEVFSNVSCHCCGKGWTEIYKLIGILGAGNK